MGIDAGWHAPHQVKAKTDPLGPAKLSQRILQTPRAILTTEFACDEFRAGNAIRWNIGIEQKWPPQKLWDDIWPSAEGAPQPPDAQVTPGADKVEGDINIQPRLGGCQDIHPCMLAQPRVSGSPFFAGVSIRQPD
jgi:hypothetical protein